MTSQLPICNTLEISSVPTEIEKICNEIISRLGAAHFSKDDIFAVHLALEEGLINAVKHGNQMNPDKKVKVGYTINTDKIEISIEDEGRGFKPNDVPDPRLGENLYKYDGRGLLLIQSFMDEVEFNQRGNCLNMIRFKDQSGHLADKDSKVQRQKTENI